LFLATVYRWWADFFLNHQNYPGTKLHYFVGVLCPGVFWWFCRLIIYYMSYLKFSGLLFYMLWSMTQHVQAQAAARPHTVSSNVRVLDTAFFIPQLGRHRRIWMYLPKDYYQSRERYPVLYLQDGQNVFDAATSFSGEWGVDEALDSLAGRFGSCIVVAIDNGGDKRLSEYSPFNFSLDQGQHKMDVKAEGDAYLNFLLHTLRPYLQKNFRIRRNGRHHFIAGSSMGALIAFYAVMKQPGKWGAAGIFSPAFWVVKQPLLQAIEEKGRKMRTPLYLFAGKEESAEMVPDMLLVSQILNRVSRAKLTTVIRSEGKHNEATWRNEFPVFYEWLMQGR
jgi:predicted alpha/beta superfamily hydrolase